MALTAKLVYKKSLPHKKISDRRKNGNVAILQKHSEWYNNSIINNSNNNTTS